MSSFKSPSLNECRENKEGTKDYKQKTSNFGSRLTKITRDEDMVHMHNYGLSVEQIRP